MGIIVTTHLKNAGYKPILLLGGATARIGDPSFREHAKLRLDDRVLIANIDRIKRQLHRLVPDTEIVDNYEWQGSTGLLDFLELVGMNVRLNSMLSRESVQRRLESPSNGMSFTEFTYQLLQAYDFLHLLRYRNCRLQLGGSDQWGNIVAGTELVGKVLPGQPVTGMTFPLLTTSTGEKMGKSDGNAVWLDADLTSPFDLYQYFLQLSDVDAERLLSLMSLRPIESLAEILFNQRQEPEQRLAQRTLAEDVTTFVHGHESAKNAALATRLLFDDYDTIFEDLTVLPLIVETLERSGNALDLRHERKVSLLSTLNKLFPDHSNSSYFLTMHMPIASLITCRSTADIDKVWRSIY